MTMNSAEQKSIFASPLLSIYAGPTKKHLQAHAEALAKSPVLRRMIEKKSKSERSIKLEAWDEQTVEYVLQWLYSGHYSLDLPPEPITDEDSKQKDDEVARPEGEEETSFISGSNASDDETTTGRFGDDDFAITPDYLTPECHRPLTPLGDIECLGAREDDELSHDAHLHLSTGSSLLPDARIYVLAEYLQLNDLQRFAFHRIQDVLGGWRYPLSTPELIAQIVHLTRYVFSSARSVDGGEEERPLRKLVLTFVVRFFVYFRGAEFDGLLAEGGGLVIDLVHKAQREWWNEL